MSWFSRQVREEDGEPGTEEATDYCDSCGDEIPAGEFFCGSCARGSRRR